MKCRHCWSATGTPRRCNHCAREMCSECSHLTPEHGEVCGMCLGLAEGWAAVQASRKAKEAK